MLDISLDLVRSTEDAAVAAYDFVGKGSLKDNKVVKENADKAATEAIRERLNSIAMKSCIRMGEGEKDGSFGLYNGEMVGQCRNEDENLFPNLVPRLDIAVDPIDGTTPTVINKPGAISALAASESGSMYVFKKFYALKAAYDHKVKSVIDSLNYPLLKFSLRQAINVVAQAKNKSVTDLMVCVLDRPRHANLIEDLNKIGVKLKLISDCDITGAISAAYNKSSVDLLYGVGGAPEATLAAAAVKCLGGGLEASEWEKGEFCTSDYGSYDPKYNNQNKIMLEEDLVSGDCIFSATGITGGDLLPGVYKNSRQVVTHSIAMKSNSGTIRRVKTYHGN